MQVQGLACFNYKKGLGSLVIFGVPLIFNFCNMLKSEINRFCCIWALQKIGKETLQKLAPKSFRSC